MGAGDGFVQGTVKILDNGPDDSRLNIVLVAEGFRDSEQSDFNNKCDEFVTTLQAEAWYACLGDAINVHRINVVSDESGADDPTECDGGTGVSADTFFDASFCNSGIRRCLSGDNNLLRDTLDAEVPEWHAGAAMVNTGIRGGCANGRVSWTSMHSDWKDVILHELGHATFDLADEYHYWEGCDSGETDRDNAPTFEPGEPNITTNTNPATLKWRHLVLSGTPVPTMQNPDCSECDDRPNVLHDDTLIGLFEGAGYYHCGRYRPAYVCRMRVSTQPFCAVCVQAIAAELNDFIPGTPTIEVVPTALDFGSVGYGLTMYRSFEVRNLRADRPVALDVELTPPTGPFAYAPGTELSFRLPAPVCEAYRARTVYLAYTSDPADAPTALGEAVVEISGDPASAVSVTLVATPIEPPPVDSVLVIDRSDSMDGATGIPGERKIDHAIEAAQLYVSLVKQNDRIGVVRYNHHADDPGDILQTMVLAGDPDTGAGRQSAMNAINPVDLSPDGFTTIGGGIILGSDVLDNGAADSRAIVVLTDGIQNTDPDIPDASAQVATKSPSQRVFAIGFGLNQLEDKLVQIASFTNGYTQITGEIVGDKEFLLQKLYVQILSDVSDEAFVKDPRMIVPPGQTKSVSVPITELDVAADFIAVHRRSRAFPKYMRVWLEAPDGTVIDPATAVADPAMEYVQRSGHQYFRLQFPFAPDNPGGHIGLWRIWVENFTSRRNSTAYGYGETLFASTMAKARSDFLLGGRVVQPDYSPLSTMVILLEPTLYGQPVALDEPVRVQVTRPDGAQRQVTLEIDEYGTYQGLYDDTPLVGAYRIEAEVTASSPLGHSLTRYRQMTGIIFVPGGGQGGGGGGTGGGGTGGGETGGGETGGGGTGGGGDSSCCRERDCEEAIWLLRRLARVIEQCCCGERTKPQIVSTQTLAALRQLRTFVDGDGG